MGGVWYKGEPPLTFPIASLRHDVPDVELMIVTEDTVVMVTARL
jgi:hypothetical protein